MKENAFYNTTRNIGDHFDIYIYDQKYWKYEKKWNNKILIKVRNLPSIIY